MYGSKNSIFSSLLDVRMAGDPVGGEVMKQPWWREQIGEPDASRQLALIARNARDIYERAGDVLHVMTAAAASSEEIAELREQIERARLRRSRVTARSLIEKRGVRLDLGADAVADALWTLSAPDFYFRLVGARRWSADAYQQWLTEALCSTLLRPAR